MVFVVRRVMWFAVLATTRSPIDRTRACVMCCLSIDAPDQFTSALTGGTAKATPKDFRKTYARLMDIRLCGRSEAALHAPEHVGFYPWGFEPMFTGSAGYPPIPQASANVVDAGDDAPPAC
jgi:hypothetical protein